MRVTYFGVPFIVQEATAQLASTNMGQTQHDKCLITIMADLPQERKEAVFIHESVHELLDGEEGVNGDEAFIRRFGNALFTFLTENDLLRDGWYSHIVHGVPYQSTPHCVACTDPRVQR